MLTGCLLLISFFHDAFADDHNERKKHVMAGYDLNQESGHESMAAFQMP